MWFCFPNVANIPLLAIKKAVLNKAQNRFYFIGFKNS
jgi:hypothetical protein